MECRICGKLNLPGTLLCCLCDSPLKGNSDSQILVNEKKQSKIIKNKRFLLFFLLPCMLLCSYVVWHFFNITAKEDRVMASRASFNQTLKNYRSHEEMWVKKKNQILDLMLWNSNFVDLGDRKAHFDGIPLEVLCAYLDDNLQFFNKFPGVSIYPISSQNSFRVVISKFSKEYLMLSTLLSLEVDFSMKKDGTLEASLVKFMKGKEEESLDLAWKSFEKEIGVLRGLTSYSGGIRSLSYKENSDKSYSLSYEYQHNQVLK